MGENVKAERKRGRPRKGAEHDADALFDAAVICFAEQGFDRATLRMIADRAGVDVALISYRYGSKFGLWCAVVEYVGQATSKELYAARDASLHLPAEEKLDRLCTELVNLVIRRPAFSQLLISETMNRIDDERVSIIRTNVAEPIQHILMNYITDIRGQDVQREVDLGLSLAATLSMVGVVVSSSEFLLDLIGRGDDMEMTSKQLAHIVKRILA